MAADVICLPSYREGFSNVIIEAITSLGIPAIVSDIYGLEDSVINHKTGLKHKVKDHVSIFQNMKKIIQDKELFLELKSNAILLTAKFNQVNVINSIKNYYRNCGLDGIYYNFENYKYNLGKKNILIIGGTGFYGRMLCEHFIKIKF